MLHKTFEEMGIPAGYGFKQLLYCSIADTLIVQTQPVQGWRPERLYARKQQEERYAPIGLPGDLISQDDPVVCAGHPLLAYNTMSHSFRADAEGKELHGANWEAIRVVDLSTRQETHVVDRETLHLADPETEVWISQVLSFAQNAESLHVVAAFSRDKGLTTNYYVAELHLPTGLVRPIAQLPAAFL